MEMLRGFWQNASFSGKKNAISAEKQTLFSSYHWKYFPGVFKLIKNAFKMSYLAYLTLGILSYLLIFLDFSSFLVREDHAAQKEESQKIFWILFNCKQFMI